MPYMRIGDLRLFYKDLGHGPILVLVPGLGGDSRAFNPALPFLRKDLRLVIPDPRGLGRSEGTPDQINMEAMAQDLLDLMEHLGVERAWFLGASLGAMVVGGLATAYPERVEKLVLCTPPVMCGPRAREVRDLLRRILESTSLENIMVHLFGLMLAPAYLDRNRKRIEELARLYGPDDRALFTTRRQMELWEEQREDWERIRVPTLIIGGDQDRLVSVEHLEAIGESISESKVVILEGVGHHLFLEAPDRVAAEVLEFLIGSGRKGLEGE